MANSISIKSATIITAVAKYTNVIFNILAGAILSRILTPNDYGIVAVVTVFSAFFSLLSDMGLGTGVIQNKFLTDEDTNNIFSFTVYMSVILTILFIIFSVPLSLFYGNRVYLSIGVLLSVSLFFNTLNMIPNALMMKNKRFIKVGIRTVVSTLVSYIITIIFALLGFKYYSLVLQSISASIITFVWNFAGSGLKFRNKLKFSSLQKILGYSSFQFVYSIYTYMGRNVDSLLTGKFMGNEALGYYNKAYNLMLYPVTYLTSVISPVLHPILSEHQEDSDYIFRQYTKVFKLLSLMGVYITVYCYFASREIVLILYGSQWEKSIPCITVLSLSIWLQMTSSSCPGIYQSLGKTRTMFMSALMYVTVQITMIIMGIITGDIYKLSCYVAVSFVFKFVIEFFMLMKKGFGISICKFYRILIPELFMFLVLFIYMSLISKVIIDNIVLSALFKGCVLIPIFLFMIFITKQHKYLLVLLPNKLRKKLNA